MFSDPGIQSWPGGPKSSLVKWWTTIIKTENQTQEKQFFFSGRGEGLDLDDIRTVDDN